MYSFCVWQWNNWWLCQCLSIGRCAWSNEPLSEKVLAFHFLLLWRRLFDSLGTHPCQHKSACSSIYLHESPFTGRNKAIVNLATSSLSGSCSGSMNNTMQSQFQECWFQLLQFFRSIVCNSHFKLLHAVHYGQQSPYSNTKWSTCLISVLPSLYYMQH